MPGSASPGGDPVTVVEHTTDKNGHSLHFRSFRVTVGPPRCMKRRQSAFPSVMSLLATLLRYSRPLLVLAVVVGIASGAASTGLLALISQAVTREEQPGRAFFVAFVGLCLLVPVTRLLSVFLLQRLAQGAILDLRLSLSRQILASPLRQLEKVGPARLLAVLTNDIAILSSTIVLVPVVVINGAIVAGCLGYLAWLSPDLFLIFVALLAFGVATYRLPLLAGAERFRRVRELQDRMLEHFRGLTEGAKELKLHARRRASFLGSLEEAADAQRGAQIHAGLIFASAAAWGHALLFLVVGALLAGRTLLPGLPHEVMVGYVLILVYMVTPLQAVLDSTPDFSRGRISLSRIEDLNLSLHTEGSLRAEPAAGLRGEEPSSGWSELALEGVTHGYAGENPQESFTLGPIDLVLRPRELVIVAGGNGSGKTTLAKLLLGLYEPEAGRIVLDGEPVTAANREVYRNRFSAVFADFHLFPQLLGLSAEGLDDAAATYLRELKLDHKVKVEGGRLSTTALSTGQRKRLALLTAYLEDRPIYLFDEWAADQDPLFKRLFYEELLPELRARGKTVVVISHDEQYYGVGDRLLKLDYGQLTYDGLPQAPAAVAVAASR